MFVLLALLLTCDGGVAQWLGRWSSAGRPSWSTPELRLTCNQFVSAVDQPTRSTQPSIPSRSVNCVLIYEITWITVVETINGRPGLRMAVRPKSVSAGFSLRPIGYSPALSVT